MSTHLRAVLLAAFFPIAITGGPRAAPHRGPSPGADSLILSTAWLAAHLGDPKVVVLHVGGRRDVYDASHIAGARWMGFEDFTAFEPKHGEGLSTELPERAALTERLEALGVSNDSRIVVYGPAPTISARLVLTLAWLGLGDRVSILDGGIDAWRAEGRPLVKDRPALARGHLGTRVGDGVVTTLQWLEANLRRPGTLVLDARDRQFFTGEAGPGMHMPRPGHIPGAHSLAYTELLTPEGRFRSRSELAQRFQDAGAAPGSQIVTYCHVGQQGSLLWLAARWLGFDARLYDGSFEEWSGHDELPVEKGPGGARQPGLRQ